jgi:hypothetical protein
MYISRFPTQLNQDQANRAWLASASADTEAHTKIAVINRPISNIRVNRLPCNVHVVGEACLATASVVESPAGDDHRVRLTSSPVGNGLSLRTTEDIQVIFAWEILAIGCHGCCHVVGEFIELGPQTGRILHLHMRSSE